MVSQLLDPAGVQEDKEIAQEQGNNIGNQPGQGIREDNSLSGASLLTGAFGSKDDLRKELAGGGAVLEKEPERTYISGFIEQLRTPDPKQRQEIISTLIRLGDKAVPELIRNINNSNPRIKEGVLLLLQASKPTEKIHEALSQVLAEDIEPKLKFQAAATLLFTYRDEKAALALGDFLKSPDPEMRANAVQLIADTASDLYKDELRGVFESDPDIEVRKTAAWALAMAEDSSIVDPLINAIEREDPEWGSEAIYLLEGFEDERIDNVLAGAAEKPALKEGALMALALRGNEDAIIPLYKCLNGEPFHDAGIVNAFRNFPESTKAISAVVRELNNPDIGGSALSTLMRMYRDGGERVVETLVAFSQTEEYRENAIDALTAVRAPGTEDYLYSYLAEHPKNFELDQEISSALVQMGHSDLVLDVFASKAPYEVPRFLIGLGQQNLERRENIKGQLQEIAENDPSRKSREVAAKILDEFQKAEKVGIDFPLRFEPEVLNELIENRLSPKPDGRPLAVVVFPKVDRNGAFMHGSDAVKDLIKHGYRVMYYEAGQNGYDAEISVEASLKQATGYGRPPEERQQADLIVLGGHGTPERIQFGSTHQSSDPYLDTGDERDLLDLGVSGTLKKDGQIVLIACSTGMGGRDAKNVINTLRNVFPQAKEGGIYGPDGETGIPKLSFDRQGELNRVDYSDGIESYGG